MAPPTSSESWSAELFPKSHPRHNNKGGGGASISGGTSMSHPHIRELVERQQQIKQLQRQLDTTNNTNTQQHHQGQGGGNNIKELYYSGKSKNVIQGLHMNHILNTNDNNSLEDGTSLLQSVPSQSQYYTGNNHPLSPHLNHSGGVPQSSANSNIHRNNIHRNTQHNNTTNMNNNNTGYEIEGTFQSKGCIPQTADDVGYLFGCGTHPHDEVVYVYNTVPTNQQQQQLGGGGRDAAMADERNLFYHTGPTNTANGGGNNVNDVLFQIDKEYQQLQTNHVDNMREPPPRYPPGHYKMQQQQHLHGVGTNMRVEQDDDEYTKRSGCSISSIMDLLLPNLRQNKASRTSNMRDSNSGYYGDYPTDNWRTLCTSPTKRKRRNKHHSLHNVVSTSSSEDSTFERTKRRAKHSVYELQQQLKAMVHDRAKSKVGTPTKKEEEEESRQESSSPKPTTSTDDKQKDIEQLRQEQATLDQARKLLQVELAQHQVQLATINANNPYYNGSFGINAQPMGGMISPLSAPITSGVGCTSGGGMMSPSPMMMNTGGMLQPQLSTGMWPQQQQGMIEGMQQAGMNMMQNTQVGGIVPQQVPSNVSELSKSIFTGAPQGTTNQGGKFIDNVGAGMSRSYSVRPTRTTQSKKKLSPPHPTRSYSNNEFTPQSNQRLSDLKSKNESIRKDISRMRECMNTSSSPSRRKGGQQRGGRPFPRTSPPSSPTRQDRDDAIARAMQRSDEARSLLSGSSGGSMPGGYRSSPNRYNRGSSRRQPPSPIRTSSRGNQEYYHV